MKELILYDVKKKEVVIKDTRTQIGKVTLDTENKIMTIISPCFSMDQVQELLFDVMSKSVHEDYIPIPFAGAMVIPGDWEIRIRSED
jgi:hypothetical protein